MRIIDERPIIVIEKCAPAHAILHVRKGLGAILVVSPLANHFLETLATEKALQALFKWQVRILLCGCLAEPATWCRLQ